MPAKKVTKNKAERLTVTLDAEDREELARLSRQRDRSLGWIVREAIHEYLERTRGASVGRAS